MGTYSTIKQRQPLRVPYSFNDQEKQLVIQLEGVFDDIYKHFGRLGMDDMSSGFRFVIDNKYDKITGITIDEDGIDIVGDKYVTIQAGDGGKWTYDEQGLRYYKTGDPLPFQIAKYEDRDYLTSGIFYQFSDTGQTGEVILLAECRNGEHTSPSGFWRGEAAFAMTDNTGDLDSDGLIGIFYPRTNRGALGTRTKPWDYLFTNVICGELKEEDHISFIQFYPDPSQENRNSGAVFALTTYEKDGQTKKQFTFQGTSGIDDFIINSQAHGQLLGFSLLSGLTQIKGPTNNSQLIIQPNASKSNVRLVVSESVENGDQVISLYKDSGVDKLRFNGDITGNAGTATIASTANNLRGADGFTQVIVRPNATKSTVRMAISESVENNKQVIKLFKDSGVDELQFIGNADSATKLSRAPTYGELSGR